MAEIMGTEAASCCAEPWLAECEHWRAVSVAQLAKEHSDEADTLTDADLRALEGERIESTSRGASAIPGDDGPAHLPAEILRELTGGPALALLLEDITLADVDPVLAVEVVAGFKRLEAWAAARAARAAAQVSRRAEMDVPDRGLEDVRRLNVAGEELAMRLGVTRAEANTLIDVGRRAFSDGSCLAPTGDALENGELDWRKTCTIVRTLRRHPDVVAWGAQDRVLPGAGLRTHNQVVRDLGKALIAVDPEEGDLRHRRARTERRVSRPRPLPDGMAAMTALLPAADAVLIDMALHSAAQTAKRDGCGLTLDELRADALTTMATTALDTGWIGTPPPHDGPSTESASSSADSPGRAVPAADGPDAPGVSDLPGVRVRRRPMPVPAGRGRNTQVRITVPLSVALPPSPSGENPESLSPDTRTIGRGGPPGRHGEPAPATEAGAERAVLGDDGDRTPDDQPPWLALPPPELPGREVAELDGYGAVAPEVARALAAGGTWQRLVTEPHSGAVLDIGRRRYRPPAEIAAHVRLRDRTCVRPGCTVPATHCQLDHTVPWAAGGQTAAHGLGAMCLRDHRIKSAGAFTVQQPVPGVFEWTTAAGLRYRRNVDGTVRLLPHVWNPDEPSSQ